MDNNESCGNRRVPLTEEERDETCPECGHRRGLHHNPDDRCCEQVLYHLYNSQQIKSRVCNCGYYFYMTPFKIKELEQRICQGL